MVSAISGTTQASQLLSTGTGSNKIEVAALKKQIAAKETEADATKDEATSATIANELRDMRAQLAALQASDKRSEAASASKPSAQKVTSEPSKSDDVSRQAEFDTAPSSDTPAGYWV